MKAVVPDAYVSVPLPFPFNEVKASFIRPLSVRNESIYPVFSGSLSVIDPDSAENVLLSAIMADVSRRMLPETAEKSVFPVLPSNLMPPLADFTADREAVHDVHEMLPDDDSSESVSVRQSSSMMLPLSVCTVSDVHMMCSALTEPPDDESENVNVPV